MSVFGLHQRAIGEYREFVRSFVNIADKRLERFVEEHVLAENGGLWPEALIQLSPAYRLGGSVDELVEQGVLHPTTAQIFRRPDGEPFLLYEHQVAALRRAKEGRSYVLTSGTGSGKSFAYFIPIVDLVVRNPDLKGPVALVVYPMNALVNSQLKALKDLKERYEERTQRPFPLRFARYTGQTPEDERRQLRDNPPHLLLTNYVMGEYLLTRPEDHRLVSPPPASAPFFLVFDELHTYRGRQGADVAILVRRLRARIGERPVIHVGTSATLVARKGATPEERREEVARFASRFFGAPISPEDVVEEVLEGATVGGPPTDEELRSALSSPLPHEPEAFRRHPLARFAEYALGLKEEAPGRYVRREPRTLSEVGKELAERAGVSQEEARKRLEEVLVAGAQQRVGGRPLFAFKLHQFLAQTSPVYGSLEPSEEREFSTEPYGPSGKLLYPLYFCRACGQEYYAVRKQGGRYLPVLEELGGEDSGYLAWVEDFDPEEDLPDSWKDARGRLRNTWEERRPRLVFVAPDGSISAERREGYHPFYFQPYPFSLCLRCGADWTGQEREFSKVTYLGSEGRTSATTVLAAALLRKAREVLGEGRDKLLSFTDNRQDASLQAGHFNDFVRTVLLRAALVQALEGEEELDWQTLPEKVLKALPLPLAEIARNPDLKEDSSGARKVKEAFKELIRYRFYADLRRGWRFAQPNLEEVGLLEVAYPYAEDPPFLEEAAKLLSRFRSAPFTPEEAGEATRFFLDHLRRHLAVGDDLLSAEGFRKLVDKTREYLSEFWAIDPETEVPVYAAQFLIEGSSENPVRFSTRGRIGRIFRERFGVAPTLEFLKAWVELLKKHDLLREDGEGYRIPMSAIRWRKGDGTPRLDPVRYRGKVERQGNPYFRTLYRESAQVLARLEGREHTAQVQGEERERRERRFRGEEEPRLPYLVASPTLELGVDIADLDMVHLRNLPPTPANYAQRVGRAGRQGQPGLVVAFAGAFSHHDRYFFRKREEMVAGSVRTPALDLRNESLLKAHIHAEWLATLALPLRDSVEFVVNTEVTGLPLHEEVQRHLERTGERKEALLGRLKKVFAHDWQELSTTGWFGEAWLRRVVEEAPAAFDRAFDTWRELYRSALALWERGQEMLHPRRSKEERERGRALTEEAIRQIDLLLQKGTEKEEGDFYPYRYLASEEFLPGYNLMALPVRAFVPRGAGEYISRPRRLALTEFAPGNFFYHEGGKWVTKRLLAPTGGLSVREVWGCGRCGAKVPENAAVCPSCRAPLDGENLISYRVLDLVGVSMKRRERITANEEERNRAGFDVRLLYEVNRVGAQKGVLRVGEKEADLLYSPSMRMHYINRGQRRGEVRGFTVDLATGEILRGANEEAKTPQTPGLPQAVGVALRVEVTQNALLFKHASLLEGSRPEAEVSLGYALKRGMERLFQVEESELGLELVGNAEERAYLFYENAEGGLGILRRLVEEGDLLAEVARSALEVLHFDEQGRDLREECARACHECLLSYNNQREAPRLNRHEVRDILLRLTQSEVVPKAPAANAERLDALLARCQSELERAFLQFLADRGLRLPDEAQYRISEASTVADFLYRPHVAVYVDGPPHDAEHQKKVDERQRERLLELGYTVVAFRYDEDWEEVVRQYPGVFGALSPDPRKPRHYTFAQDSSDS
ncbi:DEAD/DEAH box helicase [Thermus sp. LT1-2-5]|uniref:DEAD/DEAH box helicase n=1 Tax=Thermus sp. LT1-2-5 TaxID=3026935 RepID=UPI0030E9D31D